MSERKWTPAQRTAIETRDRTLLVSAAAGSGKTAALTERILASLTDPTHPTDLSRLLVVTFTTAAARDMRRKLAEALEARAGDARLERQRLLLPSAQISTIDALCNRVLRRYASEAGVSPDFRVADPAEAALLASSVLEEVIEACYAGEYPAVATAEDFCRFADTLTTAKGEGTLNEILFELYDKLRSDPRGVGAIAALADTVRASIGLPFAATPWGDAAYTRLADRFAGLAKGYRLALDETEKTVSQCEEEKDRKAGGRFVAYLFEEAELLESLARRLTARDATLADFLATLKRPSLPSFAAGGEGAERLRALHKRTLSELAGAKEKYFAYSDAAFAALLPELAAFADCLHALLSAFDARLGAEKRRRNLCDFADLEQLTLALLWQKDAPTATALSLRAAYDAIYIDEFQDVNAVQYGIFRAIAREDNLFMVGDVKQSIYSFRHADPQIFADLRARYAPLPAGELPSGREPGTVFFSENFRCDPAIVDYVNAVCGHLFRKAGGGPAYTEADDLICAKVAARGRTPVRTLFFETKPKAAAPAVVTEGTAVPAAVTESTAAPVPLCREEEWVAAKVSALLREGRKNDGTPITPADIVLLFRTRSAMARYEAALSQVVKTRATDSGDYFLNPEVLLALSLLNTVDNPRRDIYLAAALRSPIFGLTLDDLVRIRTEQREAPVLYDALRAYTEAHPDFERGRYFLEKLADWRALAEGETVGRFLLTLYRESGILLTEGPGSEPGHDNLMLLYNYARTFEATAYQGLHNFIGYINSVIAKGRILLSPAPSGGEDAVRLMTVHASKGLEFPVTFLCDVNHRFNGNDRRGSLLFSPTLGLSPRFLCQGGNARAENPIRYALADAMADAAAEEEIRLLYVALTRAQEQLYITGSAADVEEKLKKCKLDFAIGSRDSVLRQDAWLNWIGGICAGVGDPYFTADAANAPLASPSLGAGAAATAEPPPSADATAALLRRRFAFVYPDRLLSELPEKLSVSRLYPAVLDGTEEEEERPAPTGPVLPRFLGGGGEEEAALAGTATHLFMQFCDFDRLARDGAQAELERLKAAAFLNDEDAARVRLVEIEAFRRSSLFATLRAAKSLRRELRFHVNLPADRFTADPQRRALLQGRTLLVQGVIDCIVEEADGSYLLIDYKTDRLTASELESRPLAEKKLRERHSAQLAYYREACAAMYGRPPRACGLYSLPLGDTVWL